MAVDAVEAAKAPAKLVAGLVAAGSEVGKAAAAKEAGKVASRVVVAGLEVTKAEGTEEWAEEVVVVRLVEKEAESKGGLSAVVRAVELLVRVVVEAKVPAMGAAASMVA